MKRKFISPIILSLLCFLQGHAASGRQNFADTTENHAGVEISETVEPAVISESGANYDDSLFPEKSLDLHTSHFTWGAEFGMSIDMTSHDMSSVDADIMLGYKNSALKILGFGAGIHRAIGTGDNFIPVYAVIRTSFRSRPSLLFLSLCMGYSFNTISDSKMMGDAMANIGLGVNLAMNRKFQSHIVLSAGYRHFRPRHREIINMDTDNVYLVKLSFGINF